MKKKKKLQLVCSVPSWSIVYLTYLAPAFAMSGLHLSPDEELSSLWNYLLIGLLYLLLQHSICVFFAHICCRESSAALLSGLVIGQITLAGGITLHLDNFPMWYKNLSPLRWTLSLLLPQVHGHEIINKLTNCKAKHIQRQDIIVQGTCEPPDGELALHEIAFDQVDSKAYLSLVSSLLVVLLLTIISFMVIRYSTPRRPKSAPNKPWKLNLFIIYSDVYCWVFLHDGSVQWMLANFAYTQYFC